MQWCSDRVALRCVIDCRGCGDASGMPDPEVCLSGGDLLCLSGVLAHQKMKIENGFVKQTETTRRKRIRKASLHSSLP